MPTIPPVSPSLLSDKIQSIPTLRDKPLWQGPCADGPLGGVTQSMLSRFLGCRERFRLRYILGLEPEPSWNVHIGYGNMWHACEEGLAAGKNWKEYLYEHLDKMLMTYPYQRDDIMKWYYVCLVQFDEYVKYWEDHADTIQREPLMQEEVFDVKYLLPSGREVRLRGKWDSVDQIGNEVWLQENKTKSRVDKLQIERQMSFDLQTMTYTIALDEFHEKKIAGVRYNVVKRDCPIKQHADRQLKSGFKKGESTEDWMDRLRKDYYSAASEEYFFRLECRLQSDDITKFRTQFLDPFLENLCWWYDVVAGMDVVDIANDYGLPPSNWRKPFGTYDVLDEGGSSEYDSYLATGSLTGLHQTTELFPELQ